MNAKSKNKSRNSSNTDKKQGSIAESKTPRTTVASRPPSTLAPAEDLDPTISTERLSEESLEATPRTRRTMSGSGDLTGPSGRTVSSSESATELIAEGQDREGELLEAVENTRDAEQGPVKPHREPRKRPPSY